MKDQEQGYCDYSLGQGTPVLSDAEEFFSKSLELTEWFNSGLSDTGSFDVGIMVLPPFRRLLDALPVPVIIIDSSYKVAFTNQACGTISDTYKIIQGVPFASLVPRPRNSEKALAVVKKVFLTRKPVIAEGILEIDAKKVWGRLYFRSVRIGTARYVLLVIADLTSEKARLLLKEKADARKDFLISAANEKLLEQSRHLEKAEQTLKTEKERFEKLTGFLRLPVAIFAPGNGFSYVSSDFRDLFGLMLKGFPALEGATAADQLVDSRRNEVLQWLEELGTSSEISQPVRTFVLNHVDGSEKTVICRVTKLENSEYLMFCEDITRNGDSQVSRLASPRT